MVTSQVEHSSVLNYCMALEKEGYGVTYLPVDRDGLLKLADLEAAITDETALVSLMWANNETGVLFSVAQIAEIRRWRGVPFRKNRNSVRRFTSRPFVPWFVIEYVQLTVEPAAPSQLLRQLEARELGKFGPIVTSKVNYLARVRMLVQNFNYPTPAFGIAGNERVVKNQGWEVVRKDRANRLKPQREVKLVQRAARDFILHQCSTLVCRPKLEVESVPVHALIPASRDAIENLTDSGGD